MTIGRCCPEEPPGIWRDAMPCRYAARVSIRCTNHHTCPCMALVLRHAHVHAHERAGGRTSLSLWSLSTLCSKVFSIMDSCCLLKQKGFYRARCRSLRNDARILPWIMPVRRLTDRTRAIRSVRKPSVDLCPSRDYAGRRERNVTHRWRARHNL